MPSAAFVRFWYTDLVRDECLAYLSAKDQASLRLVSQEFSFLVAPSLFRDLHITFGIHTFARPARLAALDRIGGYVRKFNFSMPHSQETFLPPLLDPTTGEEQTFIYEPNQCNARPSSRHCQGRSKYGSWEMNDLLVKQYPPLFHASTDIASFIRAFAAMSELRSLSISCPLASPPFIYRQSAVDFGLISLRIAVEQTPLPWLESLSLDTVHPLSLLHLRPAPGIGARPSSTRRWRQIRNLSISMDCPPWGNGQPTDHFKILHSYLQTFSQLEDLNFEWLGRRGPCPLSFSSEPCLAPCAVDSSATCPQTFAQRPCPIKYRRLRRMKLENALLDARQASEFISKHRKVLQEFVFENVHLRSGTWDDALAPLTRISGSDSWKEKQEEVMDVPLALGPVPVEECINEALWPEERVKHRPFLALKKASIRTREMLGALRLSRLAWR